MSINYSLRNVPKCVCVCQQNTSQCRWKKNITSVAEVVIVMSLKCFFIPQKVKYLFTEPWIVLLSGPLCVSSILTVSQILSCTIITLLCWYTGHVSLFVSPLCSAVITIMRIWHLHDTSRFNWDTIGSIRLTVSITTITSLPVKHVLHWYDDK